MFRVSWNAVMDPKLNPLMTLPKTVRFHVMMVISFIWSCIFCISTGMLIWAPGFILFHVAILFVGIFATDWIFRTARRRVAESATIDLLPLNFPLPLSPEKSEVIL